MTDVLFVGLGGFIGSVLRYLLTGWVQQMVRHSQFPYGTLVVNVAGCLAIGFLAGVAETRGIFSAASRAFLFAGLLGGFTTFSAFGNESVNLGRDGHNGLALLNVMAHVVLGLAAVWLGRMLAGGVAR